MIPKNNRHAGLDPVSQQGFEKSLARRVVSNLTKSFPSRTLLIPETGRPTPLLSKTDKVGGVSLAGNKKGERGQYINSFTI